MISAPRPTVAPSAARRRRRRRRHEPRHRWRSPSPPTSGSWSHGTAARCSEAGSGRARSVMAVEFELDGQRFVALNGGPVFKFAEAVSFVVNCHTQDEVDAYWRKLSAGGAEVQCGWLKDKFGLSWQIVPTALPRLLSGPDPEKAKRVMKAMLAMKKIDIRALKEAYEKS